MKPFTPRCIYSIDHPQKHGKVKLLTSCGEEENRNIKYVQMFGKAYAKVLGPQKKLDEKSRE